MKLNSIHLSNGNWHFYPPFKYNYHPDSTETMTVLPTEIRNQGGCGSLCRHRPVHLHLARRWVLHLLPWYVSIFLLNLLTKIRLHYSLLYLMDFYFISLIVIKFYNSSMLRMLNFIGNVLSVEKLSSLQGRWAMATSFLVSTQKILEKI